MIVRGTADEWSVVWEAVVEEMAESTEKGVAIVFSVHEVETVCAVKMMQVALRTKGIHFSQYPVEHEAGLRHTLTQLLTDSTAFRTVFLINCGASTFAPHLAPPSCSNTRFVVVDSHRPLHPAYNNAADMDTIFVLCEDDPLEWKDVPVANTDLDDITAEDREQLYRYAEEEAEAEEEDDNDVRSTDSPAKRQRREEQGGGGANAREFRDKLRVLQERERQLSNYYDMGSSYGKPSPLVLLPLAEYLLAKCDNSLLWPAAVGLTDQWVHQRLSPQHYDNWYQQLSDWVTAADANYAAQQQQQQRHGGGGGGGGGSERGGSEGSGKQAASTPRLEATDDYRLMLFRHWTLFDAFCYSPYVAPRLQTWRPAGKELVALLFANMGISIEQAKTDYSSMQGRFRDLFVRSLPAAVNKSSLNHAELTGKGFQLRHSLKVTAASDVVHACTALLSEYCVADTQDQGSSALGFWRALEALDCHTHQGWNTLLKGIQDAKILQQAIIMDGGNMVTDQKLKVNPSARLQELNLLALGPTNAAEFRHPLTLLRLAHFVRDATKIARKGGGLRAYNYPIMVIGPEDAAGGWCIVIGLRSNLLDSNAQYNIFGRTFQAVLECEDSEVQWDESRKGFDASVVYIHRDSLVTFCSDVRAELISNAADAAAAAAQTQTQTRPNANGSQQQPPGGGGGAGGDTASAGDTTRRRQQQQQQPEEEGGGGGDMMDGEFSDVASLADTLNAGDDDGEGADGSGGEVDVVGASEEEEEGVDA